MNLGVVFVHEGMIAMDVPVVEQPHVIIFICDVAVQ